MSAELLGKGSAIKLEVPCPLLIELGQRVFFLLTTFCQLTIEEGKRKWQHERSCAENLKFRLLDHFEP